MYMQRYYLETWDKVVLQVRPEKSRGERLYPQLWMLCLKNHTVQMDGPGQHQELFRGLENCALQKN